MFNFAKVVRIFLPHCWASSYSLIPTRKLPWCEFGGELIKRHFTFRQYQFYAVIRWKQLFSATPQIDWHSVFGGLIVISLGFREYHEKCLRWWEHDLGLAEHHEDWLLPFLCVKLHLKWIKPNGIAIFFSLAFVIAQYVNIKLDSLGTHLEAMSLLFLVSHQYEQTLTRA